VRGRPLPDALSSIASALGDYGFVWLVFALVRARHDGRDRRLALRALLFTGAVVPVVNMALKTAVGRVRPSGHEPQPHVRIPRTTSFPSGHALAAWCAATLLSEDDPLAPLYYGAAVAISASRVHVRLHHATDVVGGSLLGIVLGHLGRRVSPLE